jgi:malto-oligosyltrehalose trehalohydrolase
MDRLHNGMFEATSVAPAGTRYGFRISADLVVPDPASRAQPDGVHGLSMVVDPGSYEWRHREWLGRPWREAVILELHVGLLGGFSGVARRVADYAELGITAVELMPIAQFPGERNWGYDGVQLYAPQWSYGGPDELKRLIDVAHGLGLMVLLDVVYNHFGPDGNYLPLYASPFFRRDRDTLWGHAIDVARPEVSAFFEDNAVCWLNEFRFDGLRFDAAHAIHDDDWLKDLARRIRARCDPARHIHLVLENDDNNADLLAPSLFDAQWNDDGHHALHRLLTSEIDGYYADYADKPAEKLAQVLSQGFLFQGQSSPYRNNATRGKPSAHLPPTAFVLFLQNHDQIGNRAFGERHARLAHPEACRAALALLLLAPQIPLLFMGEECGEIAPFLYFTDHKSELADMVRAGRRKEFARFSSFAAVSAELIPDPNDPTTFESSIPYGDAADDGSRKSLVRQLLRERAARITPYLDGCRSAGARALNDHAVTARWRLGNNALLTMFANLGDTGCHVDVDTDSSLLFESRTGLLHSIRDGVLPPFSTVALLGTTP